MSLTDALNQIRHITEKEYDDLIDRVSLLEARILDKDYQISAMHDEIQELAHFIAMMEDEVPTVVAKVRMEIEEYRAEEY